MKSRLATIIRNSFLRKNGNRRHKYLVLCREGPYFVKEHSDSKNKLYTEEDMIKMLEFLVENFFVVFAGKIFQQIISIPMGTNCAALPSSLAKVPIRFPPLPLGGSLAFRQVFKHSANLRLTSFASYMLVVGSLVMYQFVCICQRGTGRAFDLVLIIYKPYSILIFDANDISRKLAECLKTCLNLPRGRGREADRNLG